MATTHPVFSTFGRRIGLFEESEMNPDGTVSIPFDTPASSSAAPQKASSSLDNEQNPFETAFAVQSLTISDPEAIEDNDDEYSSSVHTGDFEPPRLPSSRYTSSEYDSDSDILPTTPEAFSTYPPTPGLETLLTTNPLTTLRTTAASGIIRCVKQYIHQKAAQNTSNLDQHHEQSQLAASRLPKPGEPYTLPEIPLVHLARHITAANDAWSQLRDDVLANPLRQTYLRHEAAYLARQGEYIRKHAAQKQRVVDAAPGSMCQRWWRFVYWRRSRSGKGVRRRQEQMVDLERLSGVLEDLNARYVELQRREKSVIGGLFEDAVHRNFLEHGDGAVAEGMELMFERVLFSEYRAFMLLNMKLEVPESKLMKDGNWFLTYW